MTPQELARIKDDIGRVGPDIGNYHPSGGVVHRLVQEIDRLHLVQGKLLEDLRFLYMIAKARNSDAAWRDVETVTANAIAKAEGR